MRLKARQALHNMLLLCAPLAADSLCWPQKACPQRVTNACVLEIALLHLSRMMMSPATSHATIVSSAGDRVYCSLLFSRWM